MKLRLIVCYNMYVNMRHEQKTIFMEVKETSTYLGFVIVIHTILYGVDDLNMV